MKICVFSDIHGSVEATKKMVGRAKGCDTTVLCGDIYRRYGQTEENIEIARLLSQLPDLRVAQGNNDYSGDEQFSPFVYSDYVLLRRFNKTLFFTHGHRYNAFRFPPILNEGDVICHGHTHRRGCMVANGLIVLNVGSVSSPRDGVASYIEMDDDGFYFKDMDGKLLFFKRWTEFDS